jgi:transcriptional regulator GlxA family with amidase domain
MLQLLAPTLATSERDESIRSTKATALLSEAALRLIFENFSHRLSNRLDRRLYDAMPRHVRAAIDFIHANLHQALTVIDIAEAAGVSVRSLQAGFQRFRDTTPVAYLRDIRLEAVHTELSLLENRLPVSEVALKWGFTQMGRFAAQHRAVYGCHPSETARFARGSQRRRRET